MISEAVENDVYLSPVVWKAKKISKENFDHSNVVWIEFDGKHSLKWDQIPEPHLVVQTSVATHQHCYWKVAPIDVEAVEEVNRRLTYFLEADTSGYDYQQVLRVPDTVNYKHNLPVKLIRLEKSQPVGLEIFDSAPVIEKNAEVFTYEGLLNVDEVIRDNDMDAYLISRIRNDISIHPHRSEFLMSTGHLMAEAGLDPLEIVTCLYYIDCRIKKFVGREDQLKRLSEIASIATFKAQQALYVSVYSPMDIVNHHIELDWLVPGFLHSTGMWIITAMPGTGKTQWCFDLAYRLACGLKVLDKEAYKKPLVVAFLSLEMDVVELKYIFQAHFKEFSSNPLWNKNVFVISPDMENETISIEKTIKEINPDVLIIDSISELASDDLNETEARKIMRWLKKMRKGCNMGIVAIHHNRKANDSNKKPNKLADLYGSYLFGKNTETVASMWHEDGRETIDFDFLKARFGKKMNYKIKRSENLTFTTEVGFSVSLIPDAVEPTKKILDFS